MLLELSQFLTLLYAEAVQQWGNAQLQQWGYYGTPWRTLDPCGTSRPPSHARLSSSLLVLKYFLGIGDVSHRCDSTFDPWYARLTDGQTEPSHHLGIFISLATFVAPASSNPVHKHLQSTSAVFRISFSESYFAFACSEHPKHFPAPPFTNLVSKVAINQQSSLAHSTKGSLAISVPAGEDKQLGCLVRLCILSASQRPSARSAFLTEVLRGETKPLMFAGSSQR